jgi:uncharacterized protein YegL
MEDFQMSDYQGEFEQVPFGTDNFADNPEPRCPVVLLLDTSGSMNGLPIAELNAGLVALKDELVEDPLAAKRVEIAIVTFGPVETVQDFSTVHNFYPSQLRAAGDTPMGEAINHGLDLLEMRKMLYRQNGISYYRPWVMLITDGAPTDNWKRAATRVREGETTKNFSFFAIAVQDGNIDTLSQIAVREPLKLKGLQFKEFFLWLSNSMRAVSQSAIGDKVALESPQGWAEV